MQLKRPVDYLVSQKFGNPAQMYTSLGLKGHNGIDYACPTGTKIIATADGFVSYAGGDMNEGIGIVLIHEEQPTPYKSIYWHLKECLVKVGDKVKMGQVIAISDNTGRSTGAHLHFGIKPIKQGEASWIWENIDNDNGYKGAIDPEPFFMQEVRRRGDKGYLVTRIQTKLKYSFNYYITIDGKFGKDTEKKVKDFQAKHGLVVDGIVGKNTLNALGL